MIAINETSKMPHSNLDTSLDKNAKDLQFNQENSMNDTSEERDTVSNSKSNLVYDTCISNMRGRVYYPENSINRNRNMVIIQVPEKLLINRKLALEDTEKRKSNHKS